MAGSASLLSLVALWTLIKPTPTAQGQNVLITLLMILLYAAYRFLPEPTHDRTNHADPTKTSAHSNMNTTLPMPDHDPERTDITPDCFDKLTLPALFSKTTDRDWIPDSHPQFGSKRKIGQ
jgi:hypothetical protein